MRICGLRVIKFCVNWTGVWKCSLTLTSSSPWASICKFLLRNQHHLFEISFLLLKVTDKPSAQKIRCSEFHTNQYIYFFQTTTSHMSCYQKCCKGKQCAFNSLHFPTEISTSIPIMLLSFFWCSHFYEGHVLTSYVSYTNFHFM